MKKSIITIVVGLIWILTPQVAKSQTEQDGTANLKKYYTAIDRMHGKGAIKVEKRLATTRATYHFMNTIK